MGSWRKVGAFLGLVPDEGRRDEFGDEYHDADGYRDDYDPDRPARPPDYHRRSTTVTITTADTVPVPSGPALGARRLRESR